MQLGKAVLLTSLLVGLVCCVEDETVKATPVEGDASLADFNGNESAALPLEARVIAAGPSRNAVGYQQLASVPAYPSNAIPTYPSSAGPPYPSYQRLRQGPTRVAAPLAYRGPAQHPKEKLSEKKAIPGVKLTKPEYYPKASSYSSVPRQPAEPLSPRFVPDPSRGQTIDTISPQKLQQLTQPQSFGLAPHGVHMPHYNALHGAPHAVVPYGRPETVVYEETEHNFMERMWGEVQTMRQTITNDYLGAIPVMLRNFWDAIVGAVSATSRMLYVGGDDDVSHDVETVTHDVGLVNTVSHVTARMLRSVDWLAAYSLLVNQLT